MFAGGKTLQAMEDFGPQRQALAMLLVPFQGLLDGLPELLVAAGLFQEVHAPGLHRPDHHRHVAVGRHDDGRQGDFLAVELFEQLQAADAGHPHVQQQAPRRGRRRRRRETPAPTRRPRPADASNAPAPSDACRTAGSSSTMKTVGSVSTGVLSRMNRQGEMEHGAPARRGRDPQPPPWFSIIDRLMDNPMPIPSGLVVKKRSKTRSAASGGTPTPLSSTSTTTFLSAVQRRADASAGGRLAAIPAATRRRCASGSPALAPIGSGRRRPAAAGRSTRRPPPRRPSARRCSSAPLTSWIMALMSNGDCNGLALVTNRRRRRMISAARSACSLTWFSEADSSSAWSAASPASSRLQAWA